MCHKLPLLAAALVVGAMVSGCAHTEEKFGMGLDNTFEVVRMGEMRRSVEQTALFQGPETGYTYGFVRGLNRSLARTGIGVYQIITAPFPPYDPPFTDYIAAKPVYPDNYKPGLVEDSLFATDTDLGFSGGDVFPMVPGSRFRIFDTH